MAAGTAGRGGGAAVPLALPLCAGQGQSVFLSVPRGKCREGQFRIPFSFSFLCLHSDGGPKDKQNSQKAGNAEGQQESWQHYNSQGMLRHTYDSS